MMADLREAIAAGPAHDRGRRVRTFARPELPHAGIRLVVQQESLLTDGLEPSVLDGAGLHEETPVDERLRRAENHVAVRVVLELTIGEIAGAHRPHAAITGKCRDLLLGKLLLEPDAVYRLDVPFARIRDDVHHPAEVVLHGAHGGERIECAHDEEGIAHPAEAIVPVARRACSFRNARRHRGNDGAGRLVAA